MSIYQAARVLLLTMVLCVGKWYAYADSGADTKSLGSLQAQISRLEERVAELQAGNKSAAGSGNESNDTLELPQGLEIGVGGTILVQGADKISYNGGNPTDKGSRADSSYSADLTLAKEFKESGGRAFMHLEAGQGFGIDDNLVMYSSVNRDAGDSEAGAEVTELWYEQELFNGRSAVTFGKLDPTAYLDQNEVANDETSQFLSGMFRNSPVIEFPDNGIGVSVSCAAAEWLELWFGIFDGSGSWEDTGNGLFNAGQVNFKLNLFEMPGNYRFYGWNNNAAHARWLDSERTKEAGYGFGLSFDQKVSDIVAVFMRYGWQNPEVYNPGITAVDDSNYSLEQSWSAGFQVEGKPWGRADDVFGFSLGQIVPSGYYKEANGGLRAKTEGHAEAYYRIQVNDYLSVSPDIQYIWNPYGKDVAGNDRGIFVGGVRAQVDF